MLSSDGNGQQKFDAVNGFDYVTGSVVISLIRMKIIDM